MYICIYIHTNISRRRPGSAPPGPRRPTSSGVAIVVIAQSLRKRISSSKRRPNSSNSSNFVIDASEDKFGLSQQEAILPEKTNRKRKIYKRKL